MTLSIYSHPELERLNTLLDKDPDNWQLHGVLGDWYEERGDPTYLAIRWQCVHEKRPWYSSRDNDWTWFVSDVLPDWQGLRLHYRELERSLLHELRGYKRQKRPIVYKEYHTRHEAEEALWTAWPKWKENQ